MKNIVICGFAVFTQLLYSCGHKHNVDRLHEALVLAGDNKSELIKTLDHYENDSLKLKAAEFLIMNMPGHYSYKDTNAINNYYNQIDRFLNSNQDAPRQMIADTINCIAEKLEINKLKTVEDIKIITSQYLIKNIDEAFKIWREGKWCRHLAFDQFCEYILPYKVEELQPLDDWRTRFSDFCTDSIDELDYCDMFRSSSYSAAVQLNSNLSKIVKPFSWSALETPPKRIETLMKIPFGRCDDYAWLTAAIFRSVGIPVSIDIVPHWAYRTLGHKGNAVLAPTGKTMLFSGMSSGPEKAHHIDEKIAKLYRVTYAHNLEIEALHESGEYIPSVFQSVFQKDVTDEFVSTVDLTIPIEETSSGYVFLSIYGDQDWIPVDFAKIKNKKVVFEKIGKNVLYILMRYDRNGKAEFLSKPFVINNEGTPEYILPNITICQTVNVTRKYPVIEYVHKYAKLLKDGQFEASNDKDFKHVNLIHTITDGYAIGHEIIISDSVPAYRYWRYIQRNRNAHCNISEILFFDKNNNQITGDVIGTEGHKTIYEGMTRDKVFDGNLLTSFNSPNPKGDWVGCDFGEPIKIHKIIFYGRSDGNAVEIGDCYELFYWDSDKWVSLGQKLAENISLKYENVPVGALLILRDLTKGKDERVFTIASDGRQEWW